MQELSSINIEGILQPPEQSSISVDRHMLEAGMFMAYFAWAETILKDLLILGEANPSVVSAYNNDTTKLPGALVDGRITLASKSFGELEDRFFNTYPELRCPRSISVFHRAKIRRDCFMHVTVRPFSDYWLAHVVPKKLEHEVSRYFECIDCGMIPCICEDKVSALKLSCQDDDFREWVFNDLKELDWYLFVPSALLRGIRYFGMLAWPIEDENDQFRIGDYRYDADGTLTGLLPFTMTWRFQQGDPNWLG